MWGCVISPTSGMVGSSISAGKLGEKEIRWWHELTNGYKDRQPIEEPQ